jgi:hypothetical protein
MNLAPTPASLKPTNLCRQVRDCSPDKTFRLLKAPGAGPIESRASEVIQLGTRDSGGQTQMLPGALRSPPVRGEGRHGEQR